MLGRLSKTAEEGNMEPNIDGSFLLEYPEMLEATQGSKEHDYLAHEIFADIKTLQMYIKRLHPGQPAADPADVNKLLEKIESGLKWLASLKDPKYDGFVKKERKKVEETKNKATELGIALKT